MKELSDALAGARRIRAALDDAVVAAAMLTFDLELFALLADPEGDR